MSAPTLKLKPNAPARILTGHPWVFANEVEALLPASCDGEAVECRDRRGRFLGTGIYNSCSQIVFRRFSRERTALDGTFFHSALQQALARRSTAGSGPGSALARRLVWSESDDLPGVVVDQFDDTLVVQIQTLAMEKRTALLEGALQELLRPAEIIYALSNSFGFGGTNGTLLLRRFED